MKNMHNGLRERNRRVAESRWKKVEEMHLSHINKISKSVKYKIFKSRLLGFLAGDGSIYIKREKNKNDTNHKVLFYPDHKSMIYPFIEAFSYLYIKQPTIKEYEHYYSVRVSSKFACLDLLKISKVGTYDWEVPFIFLESEKTRIEWLRAFFDCEASILQRQIQLQSVNMNGLFQVKKLLESFKIESKIYKYERKNDKWNTNYILCIMKKESRKNFFDKIGFNHTLKLEKLKKHFIASVP